METGHNRLLMIAQLFIYSLHGYSTIIASSGDSQTDISNYCFFFQFVCSILSNGY